MQATLVISYYKCIGIEGTTPGVGRGKELSLSVEDGVHPNPVAHGLMQMAHGPLHFGIPGWATAPSGALHGPGGGTGEVSSSFFRPLAPPPGIPSTSGLLPYIQELLPTSFPMMGLPAEYNFNPITG